MEGLQQELLPLGIHAILIEPGYFRTDFFDESSAIYDQLDVADYAAAAREGREFRQGMNHQQVFEAFEKNYAALIDFVKGLPEDQLNMKRSFLSDPIHLSDILASTVMLHGIHHVYEANSRFPG